MENKEQLKALLGNTRALLKAMNQSTASATGEYANLGRYSSFKTFLGKYNKLANQAAPLLPEIAVLDSFNLDIIKDSSNYTWTRQKEFFDAAYSNTRFLGCWVVHQAYRA